MSFRFWVSLIITRNLSLVSCLLDTFKSLGNKEPLQELSYKVVPFKAVFLFVVVSAKVGVSSQSLARDLFLVKVEIKTFYLCP